MVKIIVKVNLGNYENIDLATSEWETFEQAKKEILGMLDQVNHQNANRIKSYFR